VRERLVGLHFGHNPRLPLPAGEHCLLAGFVEGFRGGRLDHVTPLLHYRRRLNLAFQAVFAG